MYLTMESMLIGSMSLNLIYDVGGLLLQKLTSNQTSISFSSTFRRWVFSGQKLLGSFYGAPGWTCLSHDYPYQQFFLPMSPPLLANAQVTGLKTICRASRRRSDLWNSSL